MTRILALLPMRHHSQRVPGKNYRQLAGKPLFQHTIETLLAVPEIGGILVETDLQPIIAACVGTSRKCRSLTDPSTCLDTIPRNEIYWTATTY
jgi:CMP-N-acetylneuraminic acid synthetase